MREIYETKKEAVKLTAVKNIMLLRKGLNNYGLLSRI